MAGEVRTLADGNLKIALLTTKPANPAAITLTELMAGQEAAEHLAKSTTRFSPTASETIADGRVSDKGNPNSLGGSNYEANLGVFWLLDQDGKYVASANLVYEAVREKGALVWFVLREGPDEAVDWAEGDDYEVYEVISDNPQRPSENTGYVKRIVPLQVQRRVEGKVATTP